MLIYINEEPAASGCFKKYSNDTVEIKRMFVEKKYRGQGISKIVLTELENWAIQSGFKYAILEPAYTLWLQQLYTKMQVIKSSLITTSILAWKIVFV